MKNKKMIYITSSIVVILIIMVVAAIKVTTLNKEEDLKISAETMTINTTKKIFIDGVTTPEEKKSIYLNSTLGEIDKVKVNNKDEVKKDTVLFTDVYKRQPLESTPVTIEIWFISPLDSYATKSPGSILYAALYTFS